MGGNQGESANSSATLLCWFVCHCRYLDFQLQELESLAAIHDVAPSELWGRADGPCSVEAEARAVQSQSSSPIFVKVNVPEDACKAIVERSVTIRGFLEVWREADSFEDLVANLSKDPPFNLVNRYVNEESSFCFVVDRFQKKIKLGERVARMNKLGFLINKKSQVDLNNPDTKLGILEDEKGKHVWFGRLLAIRETPCWFSRFALNIRPVVGPAVMDNELAFLMCNQARVRLGQVVFDPFCGTGGILISAAHLGAVCIGTEIDLRVLMGWHVSYVNDEKVRLVKTLLDHAYARKIGRGMTNDERDEKESKQLESLGVDGKAFSSEPTEVAKALGVEAHIYRNFKHYGLPAPLIVRTDSTAESCLGLRQSDPWADAIITDPPYGKRASVRERAVVELEKQNVVNKSGHSTVTSSVHRIITGLLSLASQVLVDHGLLVFFLPVQFNSWEHEMAKFSELSPPTFVLVHRSLEKLSGGDARVLVTMKRQQRLK